MRPLVFPVRERILGNGQLFGHLLLGQPAFNPLFPDVLADSLRIGIVLRDVGLFEYLFAREKSSHRDALADIITTPRRNVSARRGWCKNI